MGIIVIGGSSVPVFFFCHKNKNPFIGKIPKPVNGF